MPITWSWLQIRVGALVHKENEKMTTKTIGSCIILMADENKRIMEKNNTSNIYWKELSLAYNDSANNYIEIDESEVEAYENEFNEKQAETETL